MKLPRPTRALMITAAMAVRSLEQMSWAPVTGRVNMR
jgi:hypothetical protein